MNTGDYGNTGEVLGGITLQDCEIYGSGSSWLMNETNNIYTAGFTNTLFHRVSFGITNNTAVACVNNLFFGTTNASVTNTAVIRTVNLGLAKPDPSP